VNCNYDGGVTTAVNALIILVMITSQRYTVGGWLLPTALSAYHAFVHLLSYFALFNSAFVDTESSH